MKKKNLTLGLLLFCVLLVFSHCKKDSKDSSDSNKAPAKPLNPYPSNGLSNLGTSLVLSWQCSDPDNDSLTYDVYFGLSNAPDLKQSGITGKTFSTGVLTGNTTYYWKIIAKDSHNNITSGDLWSFTTVDLSQRDKVISDYKNIYLATDSYTPNWTGDLSNCIPGTISNDFQQKTLTRINYFRMLVGLPGDITLDDVKNAKCQQGALILNANNILTHNPPDSLKCFTQDGKDATSHSNIAQGAVGPSAITLYISDPGANNFICGHRRWILYPKLNKVGHGATNGYDCLYVIGDNKPSYPANMPEYICWPPKDYIPAPLVPQRWSFSIPGAKYDNTTITMTDSVSANIPLNIVSFNAFNYGENTVVWEPTGIIVNSKKDVVYNVKVNNINVSGTLKSYEYKVVIIQPGIKKKSDSDANLLYPPL